MKKKTKLLIFALIIIATIPFMVMLNNNRDDEDEVLNVNSRIEDTREKLEIPKFTVLDEDEEKKETEEVAQEEEKNKAYSKGYFEDIKNYPFLEKEIEYRGETYVRNTAVKAYLLLGIDRKGGFNEKIYGHRAGQSDAIFVVAHDRANDRVRLLQIHRDSMAPVIITDEALNEKEIRLSQITLAFGYGDGRLSSIGYMKYSLSCLMGGLSFDGYMAGTLENINRLNDFVGGVKVKIEDDYLENVNKEFVKGKEVLLRGEMAEEFIRSRDITRSYTAYERLRRHRVYIEAFRNRVKSLLKKDSNIVSKLFKQIEGDMITDLSKADYIGIAIDLAKQDEETSKVINIDGFIDTNKKYEEFYPNMEELHDIIIRLFYRKKVS